MVDGIRMVFSKEKMIERVKAGGRGDMLDEATLKIMDNLDGQEVGSNSWNRQVHGDPVYVCTGKDGKVYEVYEGDCI